MNLQYPGNDGEPVQFPSSDDSDIVETSSPQPSPNTFSQDEPDHFRVSDWDPPDFDLGGNAEPIPANLDPSESAADSTEIHPLINGMLSITLFYFYNF